LIPSNSIPKKMMMPLSMIIDVRRQGLDGLEQRLHALKHHGRSTSLFELGAEAERDGEQRDEQRCAEEFRHGKPLKRLQVEERLDSLDVDRCAENAAQREDEYGHGLIS
jgi:hypothetical protein